MRAVAAFAVPLLLVACGPKRPGPVTEPQAAPVAEAPAEHAMPMGRDMPMNHDMDMNRGMPAQDDARFAEGKKIFDDVCSQCHTLAPPPKLAPPMQMVSMHLRQAFDSEDAAVAHVVAYAPAPDPARSILPAHAVERFGLMPPQPLTSDQLEKVGAYVWSLGEGMGMMGGMGMEGRGGMRPGDGMQMRMRHRGGGGF